jgi:hypothetical protein
MDGGLRTCQLSDRHHNTFGQIVINKSASAPFLLDWFVKRFHSPKRDGERVLVGKNLD